MTPVNTSALLVVQGPKQSKGHSSSKSKEDLSQLARSKIDQFDVGKRKSLEPERISTQNVDSDDELIEIEFQREIVKFEKKTPVHVLAMTIPCRDRNIKGSTLIELVHNKVKEEYGEIIDYACEYERELDGAAISPPEEIDGVLFIDSGKDWFMSLGGWKGMMPSEEVKDYFFYNFDSSKRGMKFSYVKMERNGLIFSIINHRLHLPKGFSINQNDITKAWTKQKDKWVDGVRTDLSYPQIVKGIDTIKKGFNLQDDEIASLQLYLLSGEGRNNPWFEKKVPENNQQEVLNFLYYLNGLMFGIEASGINAALVTGLMTLDLIVNKRLDYKSAFYTNEDGGIYPYACFGNNNGTYSAREQILLYDMTTPGCYSMKAFRENTSLSPVAVKEAILIKDWLRFNQVIHEDLSSLEQIKTIKKAVGDLIRFYFFH